MKNVCLIVRPLSNVNEHLDNTSAEIIAGNISKNLELFIAKLGGKAEIITPKNYIEITNENEPNFTIDKLFDNFKQEEINNIRKKVKNASFIILPDAKMEAYQVLLARIGVEEEKAIWAMGGGQDNLTKAFGGKITQAKGLPNHTGNNISHGCIPLLDNSIIGVACGGNPFYCDSNHETVTDNRSLKGAEITSINGKKISLVPTAIDFDGNIEVFEANNGLVLSTKFCPEIENNKQINFYYSKLISLFSKIYKKAIKTPTKEREPN